MVFPHDPVIAHTLGDQLGPAYAGYPAAERAQHVVLLAAIQRAEDVALHAEARGPQQWTVTVCTSDHIGALSMIAGLFTAYRLDILSGDVFTVQLPTRPTGTSTSRPRPPRSLHVRPAGPPPPARKILDVFEVRALGEVPPDLWQRFRADLTALVALLVAGQQAKAREEIIDRVSEVFRTAGVPEAQLFPVSIDLTNETSATHTLLTLRSADTPGFLFAFTNALAGFMVNIDRAEIRTVNGAAQDTFWVTDPGGRQITSPERIYELRVATALIKQFTYLLPHSPNPGQALRQFNGLVTQMLSRPDWTAELRNLESPDVLHTLAQFMGVSQFLWEDFLRMQHENLFPVVLDVPALDAGPATAEQLRDQLRQRLQALGDQDPAQHINELNRFKDREMFRIDLRHITGRIGFREFSEELSALAEVTVAVAADLAHATLRREFGTPTLEGGAACPWVACALGKFGGRELGFGSDIELLFVYAGEGVTSGPTAIPNSQYFPSFVRTFLSAIHTRQQGIFEIDLRLRPYGNAGPLASTVDSFQEYYVTGGAARQFERMALVRLRPVAGDPELGAKVVHVRDAFVYSGEPLDLDNIRHLRHRQATELVQPGRTNAKYSPGGLVDVEYFVQAWQIVAGHADAAVRAPNTLDASALLAEGGHWRRDLAAQVQESYGFLRRLIDALRAVRGNAKDLTIPPQETREFAYLAQRLRFASATALHEAITARMGFARALWDEGPLPG